MIVSLLAIALATAVGVGFLGPGKGLLFVIIGLVLSGVTGFLGAFTGGWIVGRARKERLDKKQLTQSLVAGQVAAAFLRGFLFAWLVLWLADTHSLVYYGPLLILAWFWSLRILGDLSLSYGLHFLGAKQSEEVKAKLLQKRLEFLEANGRIEIRALAGTVGFALVILSTLAWQHWGGK